MSDNVKPIRPGVPPESSFDIELRDWIAQKCADSRALGGHLAGIACILLEVDAQGRKLTKTHWFFDGEHDSTGALRAHTMASQLSRDTMGGF